KYIEKRISIFPRVGIILGSGLGRVADDLQDTVSFSYKDLPHFPKTGVDGHSGKLVFGHLSGKLVVVMQGRPHYYEGFAMKDIVYPVRLMKMLGAKCLIVTAAVGAVNSKYHTGDIVFLKDHINFMGYNPLIGAHNERFGERFPDMGCAYDRDLLKFGISFAKRKKIHVHQGVYVAVSGPSYETPSEIRVFGKLGGDVVGMSVVPEVIAARQMSIRVVGICNVSNTASSHVDVTHKEVLAAGKKSTASMTKLIKGLVCKFAD
ncbi:MAG: purine-nucleoside phosphorylase, partial [bacterium]